MLYINFSQLARDKLVDWYQSTLLVTGVQKRYIWNHKSFPSKSDNEPFATAAPHFFTALPSSRPKVSALSRLLILCSHQFKMCNFHAHLFWAQCNSSPQDSQGMVRSSLLTLFQTQVDCKIRNKKKRIVRQNRPKKIFFYACSSFLSLHLTESGKIHWSILLWGSGWKNKLLCQAFWKACITCMSFSCPQRKVHVSTLYKHIQISSRFQRWRSTEETICCESSKQGRVWLSCVLSISLFQLTKEILTCTSWNQAVQRLTWSLGNPSQVRIKCSEQFTTLKWSTSIETTLISLCNWTSKVGPDILIFLVTLSLKIMMSWEAEALPAAHDQCNEPPTMSVLPKIFEVAQDWREPGPLYLPIQQIPETSYSKDKIGMSATNPPKA